MGLFLLFQLANAKCWRHGKRKGKAIYSSPSASLFTTLNPGPHIRVVCVCRNLEDKELAWLPFTRKSANSLNSVDSPPAPVELGGQGNSSKLWQPHSFFCTLGNKVLCLCPSSVSSASSHETVTGEFISPQVGQSNPTPRQPASRVRVSRSVIASNSLHQTFSVPGMLWVPAPAWTLIDPIQLQNPPPHILRIWKPLSLWNYN